MAVFLVAFFVAVLRAAGIGDDVLVLLGGSSWDGEEGALLDIFSEIRNGKPNLALVLVPRHAERSEAVIDAIQARGFEAVRRSGIRVDAPRQDIQQPFVLLVDTTGELRRMYACADVIYVGKSLMNHGGQNILEPAVYGKPIVVGPNMENFPVVMADFRAVDAVIQVQDKVGLKNALRALVDNEDKRVAVGKRAEKLVEERRGALKASAELLEELIGDHG